MIAFLEIWFMIVIIGAIFMIVTIENFVNDLFHLLFGRKSFESFLLGILTMVFGIPYVLLISVLGYLISFFNWVILKLTQLAIFINKSIKINQNGKSS
jgi:hypothetical protein